MDTISRRPRRTRILGLAAVITLVAMLMPALAGIAFGHHASIVLATHIDCNGNVTYTVNDWTTDDTNGQAEATFRVSWATAQNSSTWHTVTTSGAFTSANHWTFVGSFSVDLTTVHSVVVRADNAVWGDNVSAPGPYYSKSISAPTTCSNPSISTVLVPSSPVAIGAVVHDTATLTGASKNASGAVNAGGTVTYTVYTNDGCTLGAQSAGTVNVTNGVVPNSNPITFSNAGTWYWQAVYSGDANNAAAKSTCNEETLVVDKNGPSITTVLVPGSPVAIGTVVHDTATLSNATASAGGTVTYTYYTNDTCTAGAQSAGTVNVTNGVVPNSNPITFSNAGTWYWQAVYSGDANNAGAKSSCNEETLVVDPTPTPTPSPTPTPTPTATPTATATASPTASSSGSQGVLGVTSQPSATPAATNTSSNSSGEVDLRYSHSSSVSPSAAWP